MGCVFEGEMEKGEGGGGYGCVFGDESKEKGRGKGSDKGGRDVEGGGLKGGGVEKEDESGWGRR